MPITDGKSDMALTARQARFVAEYLIDLNATRAAARAGYSEKTATRQGPRLLCNVVIADAIQSAQAKRAKRTDITQDRVLNELAKVGFASMRNFIYIDASGEPVINMTDTPPDELDALSEVQTETRYERDPDGEGEMRPIRKVKIKLHDKLAALDKIARHLGMYKDAQPDFAVLRPFSGFLIERAQPDTSEAD